MVARSVPAGQRNQYLPGDIFQEKSTDDARPRPPSYPGLAARLRFEPPLTGRLEQGDPRRDRHVETRNAPSHGNGDQPVAPLPDEPPQTGAFRPEDQGRG